jgi:hypothetical protein
MDCESLYFDPGNSAVLCGTQGTLLLLTGISAVSSVRCAQAIASTWRCCTVALAGDALHGPEIGSMARGASARKPAGGLVADSEQPCCPAPASTAG